MENKTFNGDNGLASRFFMNNYYGFNTETGEWYDYEFKSCDEIIKALRDQASGRLRNDIYSDSNPNNLIRLFKASNGKLGLKCWDKNTGKGYVAYFDSILTKRTKDDIINYWLPRFGKDSMNNFQDVEYWVI